MRKGSLQFMGNKGDIVISRPIPGVVHVSLYRLTDPEKLDKIKNFLTGEGYKVELNTVGHTVIYACGDGSMELSLKQEKECLVN